MSLSGLALRGFKTAVNTTWTTGYQPRPPRLPLRGASGRSRAKPRTPRTHGSETLRQPRPCPRLELGVPCLRLTTRRLEVLEPRVGFLELQELLGQLGVRHQSCHAVRSASYDQVRTESCAESGNPLAWTSDPAKRRITKVRAAPSVRPNVCFEQAKCAREQECPPRRHGCMDDGVGEDTPCTACDVPKSES